MTSLFFFHSFLVQREPKVQMARQKEMMMATIITMAAAPEVDLNSFFTPMRHPIWGEPLVMSLFHQKVVGWHMPWQSRVVSMVLISPKMLSSTAFMPLHLASAAFLLPYSTVFLVSALVPVALSMQASSEAAVPLPLRFL